jgi:hypothetical protein
LPWHILLCPFCGARVCYDVSMPGRISKQRLEDIAQQWPQVLSDISEGAKTINQAVKDAGISRDDLRSFRRDWPGAEVDWKQAKEERADSLADEIHATLNNSSLDPQYARVKIDALKWLASKFYPHFYNDKAQLDINVKTLDLTQIVNAAQVRLIAARAERVIEGTVIDNVPMSLSELL